MSRAPTGVIVAFAVGLLLFASAFVIAPRSCEGGLSVYFWLGVFALVVLLALPFVTRLGSSVLIRSGWAVGLVLAGAGVWVAGLAAANVRLICRLI